MKLNNYNFQKNLNKDFSFENNPSVAVAVSGGPDSMALLYLITNWIKIKKGQITVLIVDHKLRKHSKEEANSIYEFLTSKKIKTRILNVRKKNVIKKNMNEARINRYNLLTNYCRKKNILHLFVGHHLDDNLETFVYRKVSGSDFEGLQSIKNKSVNNKIIIARPLVYYKKDEILKYNKKNSIPFIKDESNHNLKFTRPIIRKFLNETDNSNLSQIKKDFEKIKTYSSIYNSFISQILIKNIKLIKKKYVILNLESILILDELIITKIIIKIYNFFFHKNSFVRSKKVNILIKEIKSKNFNKFNLKSMLVQKHNNSLIFSKKNN